MRQKPGSVVAKQTDAAHDENCAKEENPSLGRKEKCAYGDDTEDDEDEADVFGIFVFAYRFSLSIIISHKNTRFTLCGREEVCYTASQILKIFWDGRHSAPAARDFSLFFCGAEGKLSLYG